MKAFPCCWSVTIALLLFFSRTLYGATYYVDYATGADNNNGTSTVTPWKHCPGDANATGTANSTPLIAGDTVNFKGGVKYPGKITLVASGTIGSQITYQGQPTGWGTGKAIIDGSTPLSMTVCTGNGTGAGQVPNANFASIYKGTMPVGADWRLPVFESDTWLDISQTSVTNPTPFFFEDTEYFTAIGSGITATSATDPIAFNQSDPAYWVGSRILVHVTGNDVADAEITGFNPVTDTVTYASVGTPLAATNWDNKFHYAIVNNPRLISGPGQYAIDTTNGYIYVWPRANSNAITVGSLAFGFSTNSCSYVTIDGFVISGQYASTFVPGRAVNASTSNPTDGIIIQNCDIKNHGGQQTGATYLYGAGTTKNVVQNCTFDHLYGRGPFVTGNNISVKNNTITYLTGTCIYSQNFSSTVPNINGEYIGNTIDHCRGVHQNAMTVYGGATAVAANWVIANNVVRNFSQRYGNFGMSVQIHKNFLVYNNLFDADGGFAGDDLAVGGAYFRMYNNTFTVPQGTLNGGSAGVVRLFGLANSAINEFKNNICNGLYISDSGSSGSVNWSHISYSNNVYTSLFRQQDPAYVTNVTVPWALGPGETTTSASALFASPGTGNYQLKATDLTAVDKGLDLSTYVSGDVTGASRPSGIAWDIGAYELVQTNPVILTQPPANQNVAAAATVTFPVLARGQAPLSYQWKKGGVALANGGIVSGATSATLTLTGVTNAADGTYTVDVSNSLGPLVTSANSSLIVAAVIPSFTTQPPASQTVLAGTTVNFAVVATGTPTPTLQWKKNGTALTNGGNIAGATTATLTLTNVSPSDNATYTVEATNIVGTTPSGNSVLTVNIPPVITTHPTPSQTLAVGNSVTLNVAATGTPTPTFQWQKGGVDISGATGASLTLSSLALTDSGTYTAVATNAGGTVTSNNAVVTVVVGFPPAISAQPPATQTAIAGTNVTFSVTSTGLPTPTYQWQKGGANISGATSASLTLNAVTLADAGTYAVVVTNAISSVTSSSVVLTVTVPPVITTQPSATLTVTAGNTASFTVVASSTPAPTYQWKKGGVNIAGATSATLSFSPAALSDAGIYTVVVTNPAGTVTSNTAVLTVNAPPSFTSQPQGATVAAGLKVSFQADATQNATYQWQESTNSGSSWTSLSNNSVYSGTTSNILTITGAGTNMNGFQYRVIATNSTGNTTSSAATLNVITAPFPSPADVAVTSASTLLVSDKSKNTIQSVSSAGTASLLAGNPGQQGAIDGTGSVAIFRQPSAIVLDTAGNLFVADTGNSIIRRITPGGDVTTLAGAFDNQGFRDATGIGAWFNQPAGIAIDSAGNLYVADTGNSVIRKISPSGVVTTLAGMAGVRGSVDGAGAAAQFNQPTGITIDSAGNAYVADTLNQTIRRITPSGTVSTVAGLPGVVGIADGNALTDALFNRPTGVTIDGSGNLYVSDTGNSTIRRFSTKEGSVSTLAGLPTISGLKDGTGTGAWFSQPMGLRLDGSGNLYVADNGNAMIRRVSVATGAVTTMPITQSGSTPPPTPPTIPTPTPAPPATSSGGGGGGAPSPWFLFALLTASAWRYRRSLFRTRI